MSPIIARLDTLLQDQRPAIEDWLHAKRSKQHALIYTSVDLRHFGHKLAPVDTNIFPAGFNNLSPAACKRAVKLLEMRFSEMQTPPERILIVPENHTRNLGYLENLHVLSQLMEHTGREVRIGSLVAEEPLSLVSLSGQTVMEYPLKRNGDRIETADGFVPDFVLLNNDCTAGAPALLEGIAQPIEPTYQLGWYNRRKSEHFRAYEQIARDFAATFNFDPWLISAAFHRCGVVDFREQRGIECVMLGVEKTLHSMRRKYEEYGISETPYVFVKADSGTYGMGIMTVSSADQLAEINKKTRNKMNVIKEGTQNTEVIIQEGVPTIDLVEGAPAEPMLYLVDGIPVGGAYRINAERDAQNSLNASGMRFAGMCDEGECGEEAKDRITIPGCNFDVFGLVGALAALAASSEVYGLDIGFSI